MKSFAVIGLGLFGSQLAKELALEGHSVLAIDIIEEHVNAIADYVTKAVSIDAKNKDGLQNLGISKYDTAIVAITSDLSAAMLVTMNLKMLGVKQIVCKVQGDYDRDVLTKIGADMCIIPEHIAANKLVTRLTSDNVLDINQISDTHSIIEIIIPASWVGKSIIDLNVRKSYGVNIISVTRKDEMIVDFNPSDPLKKGDILLIVGSNKNIGKIKKIK